MERLGLLILDGADGRQPGLAAALQGQGWELSRADSAGLVRAPASAGRALDLVLFDPATLGASGLMALSMLKARQPRLAVAGLGPRDPGLAQAPELEGMLWLDRSAGPGVWAPQMREFLDAAGASARKLTTEDLFADILSDLEGGGPAGPLEPARAGSPAAAPAPVAVAQSVPAPVAVAPSEPVPADEPNPEQILEVFGNYNLLEKVAVGGMAELFKASQRGPHEFEKIVAIKRILPHLSDNEEFVRMFIDEAKLAAQLSHPNIAQIFDLGKANGFYYIAMEYVDGRDLRNLLRKIREYRLPMPEPLAATVVMKVANALDYAHRKRAINDRELKLVHRDISPQNILISFEGRVKLVDFGIAKAATKSTQTQAGALKGKLLYMSPEQALGLPLDGRTDLYSLGLVLAELLTGERCFQADSELGVLEKVRLGKVIDYRAVNPGISQEMAAILERALQRDPEQRYGSARLMERDLKALMAHQGFEPTEQDVAVYVNTLLKGTRQQCESLLSSRFKLPVAALPPRETAPAVPPPVLGSRPDDQLTRAQSPGMPEPQAGFPAAQARPPLPPLSRTPTPALARTPTPAPSRTPAPRRAPIPARTPARTSRTSGWLLPALGLAAIILLWTVWKLLL